MKADLVIAGGVVVTMDPHRRVIQDGAIAITEDRIVKVGTTDEVTRSVQSRRTVAANRKAILPGLIDAHAHAGHSLMKTIGAHLAAPDWLRMIENVYFRATTPEYWYADGMLAALEKLRFGITCGVMMLGNAPRTDAPEYGDAFANGSARIGTRTILSVGPPGPPWPRTFTRWEDNRRQDVDVSYEQTVEVTETLLRRWHNAKEGRLRVMLGPSYLSVPSRHDYFFNPAELSTAIRQAEDIRALANQYGVFIHIHAYEGVIDYAHEHLPSFLGPDVLLAHCTGIIESEQRILAESSVKVAHCPNAHRIFTGRCPVPELINAGVTVAIATDASAPDRTFDLFEAMRTAQRLQRLHFADPGYFPAGKALEAVTIDAATAVGMADTIGSLEVGKKADAIIVDLWRPHMVPTSNPLFRLVHEASGQDVTDVFVDGRPVLVAGSCATVNQSDVLELAERQATQAIERAGISALLNVPDTFWRRTHY